MAWGGVQWAGRSDWEEAAMDLESQRRELEDRIAEVTGSEEGRRTIGFAEVRRLAEKFGSVRDVEVAALDLGTVPTRYLRNIGTIGIEGQRRLLQASVAVVGLGGLGGYVAEALARMGVGCLTLIDHDAFEAHNLNRQLLSREDNLGEEKAEAACQRIRAINGAVTVICREESFREANAARLLEGVDVVVDALDRVSIRLVLQDASARLGIPMVHGSIGGFLGEVMTIFPGDLGLHGLYGDGEGVPDHGIEWELGTPAATPMAVAAWEVQEVVKILTDRGELLRNRLLILDMETGTVQTLTLG